MRLFLIVLFAALTIQPAYVFAEEQKQELTKEQQKQKEKIEAKIAETQKKTKEAQELMGELSKDLNEVEARHLSFIYNNHNLLGVVKQVQSSIAKAVAACSKENPDMKSDFDKKFKAWKGEVSPVMDEAKANLNNLIIAQDYAPVKKLRKALSLMDKARKAGEEIYDKQPVSSKEECEKFSGTLSGTQEKMVSLLRRTLISLPKAFEEKTIKEREAAEAKVKKNK